ncbi:hypothetical protein FH972_022044 [Carpinus fangiana]|uniref:Uncharacterized protein n=1 Tax=Carpinus fangiana TaxID=176857 RepID=A0A5N6KRF9_9ROSI|nr:hypothetical protein FH972_022044 [Carpinus fangiana]
MPTYSSSTLNASAASKNSSDFDCDFRERAKVLLDHSDSADPSLRPSSKARLGEPSSHGITIRPIASTQESYNTSHRSEMSIELSSLSPSKNLKTPARPGTPLESAVSSCKTSSAVGHSTPGSSPPVVGGVKISVTRKSRLPWLDGTRQSVPRATTMPMPGAFVDATAAAANDRSRSSISSSLRHSPVLPQERPLPLLPLDIPTLQSRAASGIEPPEQPILKGIPIRTTPVTVPPLRIPTRSFTAQLEYAASPASSFSEPMHDGMPISRKVLEQDDGHVQLNGSTKARVKGILKQPTRSFGRHPSLPRDPFDVSIQRLDHLMGEASHLAQDAAERGNADDLYGILESANAAANNASALKDTHTDVLNNRLSDSDHTSTYSSISSSSDSGNSKFTAPQLFFRQLSPQRRASTPMFRLPGETITRDWAYASGTLACDANEIRRRRKSLPDEAMLTPSPMDTADTESRRSLLSHASSMGQSMLKRGSRQPMGFEGPDSPFDNSPRTDVHGPRYTEQDPKPLPSWGADKFNEKDYVNTDALKSQRHVTLKEGQRWSIHHHRRQPIARNWSTQRKRLTAVVTCLNTALIGMIIGIYAGEVPAIQFKLTDQHHYVNVGNVLLYLGMMLSTFFFWPLPLLHGRKPYTVTALAVVLPLHFPQALMVMETRDPNLVRYRVGLLVPRALIGFALGFVHINLFSTLLDLFGASLQSENPHGEVVIVEDVRRHGGGMGLWLGGWSFCFIGSLAVGFFVGAEIISGLDVSWGFYISVILVAVMLLLNVMTPETRRSPHRRTMREVQMTNMNVERRVGRGEVKIHISGEGPMNWREEVLAGIQLSLKMFDQVGFFLMSSYLGWVYAQVWLIIVLLGNLLSTEYRWRPEYIGLGSTAMAVGAALAIPLSRANLFSRSRDHGPRTDSMTFQPRLTWTSHLVRRTAFMTILPLAGLAYTLGSAGRNVNYMVPIAFSGLVGFVSNLAVAECHGIIMETFDTSDLQPGVNSRHRLQSLAVSDQRRRTSYSSYPRVSAGLAVTHSLGFGLAAAATGVSGALTRAVGAQKATGIVASILAVFTVLLTLALLRYKSVQVIPNELFGSGFGSGDNERRGSAASTKSWRAVIIGNPSGAAARVEVMMSWRKTRIMNVTTGLNATHVDGVPAPGSIGGCPFAGCRSPRGRGEGGVVAAVWRPGPPKWTLRVPPTPPPGGPFVTDHPVPRVSYLTARCCALAASVGRFRPYAFHTLGSNRVHCCFKSNTHLLLLSLDLRCKAATRHSRLLRRAFTYPCPLAQPCALPEHPWPPLAPLPDRLARRFASIATLPRLASLHLFPHRRRHRQTLVNRWILPLPRSLLTVSAVLSVLEHPPTLLHSHHRHRRSVRSGV